jgi:hypothetical protein
LPGHVLASPRADEMGEGGVCSHEVLLG